MKKKRQGKQKLEEEKRVRRLKQKEIGTERLEQTELEDMKRNKEIEMELSLPEYI